VDPAQHVNGFWPLGAYAFGAVALIALLLGVSWLLGARSDRPARPGRGRDEPFESGIVSLGFGRFRISAHFYVVAMLFVLFDLEVVYLIAWAVAWDELGWHGYWGVVVFVGILAAGLAYEWRVGALDWAPRGRAVPPIRRPVTLRQGGSDE